MELSTFKKASDIIRRIENIEREIKDWGKVLETDSVSVRLGDSYHSGYYLNSSLDIMWLKEIEVKRLTEKLAELNEQFKNLQCQ